jgi:hypothetical protein
LDNKDTCLRGKMNQQEILNSLGDHMDSLGKTITFALFISVMMGWAGLTRADPVDALGITIPRTHAFWVAFILYFFVNTKILVILCRLGSLVDLLDKSHLSKGMTKLAVHPLIANPFCLFSVRSKSNALGIIAIISVWYIASVSLNTLADAAPHLVVIVLYPFFVIVGLFSLLAIRRLFEIALRRDSEMNPLIASTLKTHYGWRKWCAYIGVIVAFTTTSILLHLGMNSLE